MRVTVGKAIRVGPGDEVTVRGQLPASVRLGRLYVFAREITNDQFSPYVPDRSGLIDETPKMVNTLTLRLTQARPTKETSFVADIDGFVCVMQEVDTASDPRAKVKLTRKICPYLPWKERISRKLSGILAWQTQNL